jgi:hypothetical protein
MELLMTAYVFECGDVVGEGEEEIVIKENGWKRVMREAGTTKRGR